MRLSLERSLSRSVVWEISTPTISLERAIIESRDSGSLGGSLCCAEGATPVNSPNQTARATVNAVGEGLKTQRPPSICNTVRLLLKSELCAGNADARKVTNEDVSEIR